MSPNPYLRALPRPALPSDWLRRVSFLGLAIVILATTTGASRRLEPGLSLAGEVRAATIGAELRAGAAAVALPIAPLVLHTVSAPLRAVRLAPPPAPPAPKPAPRPAPTPAPAPAPVVRAAVGGVWQRLAACESGGNWSINSTFDGGLQFSPATWNAMGGRQYASYAYLASPGQQIAVAERLQARQGWGAWPACARKLGLR